MILAVGALVTLSWATRTSDQRSASVTDDVTRVEVDVSAGRIEVVAGDSDEVTIESRTTRTWFGDAEVAHEVDGDTLRIDGRCGRDWWIATWCRTDVTVTVPAGVDVVADSSAGTVTARGLDGSADLTSSAGAVRVENHSGDLIAHSSAGSVTVDGLRSDQAKITSSAGSVEVHAAVAPRSLDAESSAGRVVVTLPDDESYDVEADTSAGETTVEVPTDSSSAHQVRAFSSAGSVTVTTDR